MDLEKAVRQAMDTGKVELGMDSTMKAAMTGRARLVIVSSKFPAEARSDLRHYTSLSKVPVLGVRRQQHRSGEGLQEALPGAPTCRVIH